VSNLVWRDQVPNASRLILHVAVDPNLPSQYVAAAKIWTDNQDRKVAEFDHQQLSKDGDAAFNLNSAQAMYTAHVTVTFSGAVPSGAIISSRIEKPGGETYGTNPAPHPVAGQSSDVGWQTITIRMKP
jgi:hypothetical protein